MSSVKNAIVKGMLIAALVITPIGVCAFIARDVSPSQTAPQVENSELQPRIVVYADRSGRGYYGRGYYGRGYSRHFPYRPYYKNNPYRPYWYYYKW